VDDDAVAEQKTRLAERMEAWSWLIEIVGQMLISLLAALF
jgi:hypothetical protein